jgi:uncharacterized iron-regulated protein
MASKSFFRVYTRLHNLFHMRLAALIIAPLIVLLAACAHSLGMEKHPLAGRIWDTRAARFISSDEVFARAARARHVILGETHDNPEHHRLQLAVLQALAAHGEQRLLAMEQLDVEHQASIDAARPDAVDAEAIAEAGRFDRKGWDWPRYRPLVQFALERGWPLAAANLSRADARAIVSDSSRSALPPAPQALREALEKDIAESHCGSRPGPQRLSGMVEAQRARDARMASVLRGPSVLIAGAGHARRDRGVPLYIADGDVVSIAFVEVRRGVTSPQDYFSEFAGPASFDYLWFTPRAERPDPCAR